ncbi:MAG: UDP-N-acetylmuramoyl-L-alanyl-D-glutamate--2,6-diaminopimelate ligase [Clostridiales bacterium]|jgi:UDP-N-acetylmuramoyl-L-alanyl-D-glutamate--2,6-diaminopimelate ligase|nr:UDP-N-acetylmuramoyl-L-alanyl-D-glutamate--2,6-diaminopimelate ligase [Clostridiales bacterium]
MLLSSILRNLQENEAFAGAQVLGQPESEMEINGINYDSRKVKPGDIFVAISGDASDGHNYMGQALRKGAVAFLLERPLPEFPNTPQIITRDSRRAMAALAALWWDHPDRKLRLTGVTGTNGKTTTVNMLHWIWQYQGEKSGLIGTINNQIAGRQIPSSLTTPESCELFALLRQMVSEGCTRAAMEVSSHGLKQGRVAGCNFAGVIFTNLTQDHLDFHRTWGDYLNSKLELLRLLAKSAASDKYSVINIDDPSAGEFLALARGDIWTYGTAQKARLRLLDYSLSSLGTVFDLRYRKQGAKEQIYSIKIPLIGRFNIYNALAAIAAALAEGFEIGEVIQALAAMPQVPGRFELLDEGQDFTVAVDYAHSPDGLQKILATAREMNPRRLICVFGCGGDRDRTKRPIMGRIAGENSDFAIITSDNPRSEEPEAIVREVESGVQETAARYLVQVNRRDAIESAIAMAKPGDILLIAGKGHEDYQLVKGRVLPFDDRETARHYLRERAKKQFIMHN